MAHIDPTITAINDSQKAVINKYGFELRDDNGQFVLIDPVLAKVAGKKSSHHTGGNLDLLLTAAVKARREREKYEANAKGANPGGNGNRKPKPKTAPKTVVADTKLQADDPVVVAEAAPSTEPFNTLQGWSDIITKTPTESSEKPAAEESTVQPEPEPKLVPIIENIENKAASNPKREKPTKKELSPKVKKESRYARAAKALLANPNMDTKALAKATGLSEPTAGYCLEAWNSITNVLIDHGLLRFTEAEQIKPTV